MYSRYNEEKSVAAEKFITVITFLSYNIHIYKHMTDVSKNAYFHVLNDIVDKYNKPFRRTIGIKPIGVKSDFYAEYNVDPNEKDHKFKIGDHVRISGYKNIF